MIKEHFERHKSTYIFIGIAGITCLIMRCNPRPMWGGVLKSPYVGIGNTASFIFGKNEQTVNVLNVPNSGNQDYLGLACRNVESGRVFLSQKKAADTFSISEGYLSNHLKGRYPDANGLHFERVNLVPKNG